MWKLEPNRLALAALVVGSLAAVGCGGSEGGGRAGGGKGLPVVVHGGGRSVVVDLHASHPVYFSANFSCGGGENGEGAVEADGSVDLGPGDHFQTFDVNGDCWYGLLEVGMPDPPVGAQLSWKVTIDGLTWQEEDMTLDAPLQSGYAFFLQTGWEDDTLDALLRWHRENP